MRGYHLSSAWENVWQYRDRMQGKKQKHCDNKKKNIESRDSHKTLSPYNKKWTNIRGQMHVYENQKKICITSSTLWILYTIQYNSIV